MNRIMTIIQDLLELISPYRLPLFFLLLVVGRMFIFGDARIPVGKIFQTYVLPFFK